MYNAPALNMYSTPTQLFPLDPQYPDPQVIALAAERLRAGGLVAFPTETVYGLGANAFDEQAIERIFEVKRRPSYDPLIVHIASIEQLDAVASDVPELARRFAEGFWPGPLTLVLKKRPRVAANVSSGMDTVAVRMPDHKIPLALIEASGVPVAAPSANLFTRPSPTLAQHVLDDLDGHVDIVLDGGSTLIGLESTVLDLTGTTPSVLRPGGVPLEVLRQVVPDIELGRRLVETKRGAAMPSPGMLARHYSPSVRFLLFTGSSERYLEVVTVLTGNGIRVGLMAFDEDAVKFAGVVIEMALLGSETDQAAIGQNLFARMRELEKKNVDVIVMRAMKLHGLGLAIWDRLYRAADGQVHDLDGGVDVDALVSSIMSV